MPRCGIKNGRGVSEEFMGVYDWPLEGLDLGPMREAIARSAREAERFAAPALKAFHAGRYHEAVAWAQLAADTAWNAHTGRYAWPELENMLLQVAGEVGKVRPGRKYSVPTGSGRTRVLHVFTIAYQTGGHTRLAERLIRNSSDDYCHAVVNTSLPDFTPGWLVEAAENSGGWLLQLDRPCTDLLRQARTLREIARSWADVVVLHTHPNDPLPILAFGEDAGPPVMLLNHADHVFWLGGSIADVVAEIRPVGMDLSLRRRGVRNSTLLPVPLIADHLKVDRAEARRQLGLDEETTVLLTISSAYKFAPFGGYDFLSLIRKVIDENPGAVLLAVGPHDSGPWAVQREATGGRIRALGEHSDIGAFYAAADVFVDSFPYGSMTAMLDAGMHGIASTGLLNPLSRVNLAGDISQERCGTHHPTREGFVGELNRLIADAPYRRQRGAALAAAVREDHIMPEWRNHLSRLMDKVPSRHAPAPLPALSCEADMDDLFLTCVQQAGTMSNHVYFFIAHHIKYLPAGARYSLALDNLLRRGIFSDRKLRMKHFRSYRIPSGKQVKKWFRGIRKRSRICQN